MHKTHANSPQRIVIDNKQTRPAGSHAVQWPIVHHTPQLPCAALPERGRRNGMSTARTKWCDVRNAAMERRARRATAMKMTKTMSNDGDQTWWTAVEARLLAPWSTQNCALKRKRQPCECRSDEQSGPRSKRPRVSGVFPPHHSACTEALLTEVGHIRRSLQYQTPYPNPALSPTAPNITLQGL